MPTRDDWKVVPLSPGQLLDVNPDHVLENGLFRLCDTYKGGGGYDSFPRLARSRFGEGDYGLQFVVQLRGCTLDCPFCYVTREGVWGDAASLSSGDLVAAFNQTRALVFHLMGGAPALYLDRWPELLDKLWHAGKPGWVFTSDLMVTEFKYEADLVRQIARPRCLYAVGLKGITSGTFKTNTRRELPGTLLWENLARLERALLPYYVTFTNVPPKEREMFWRCFEGEFGATTAVRRRSEELVIDLVQYGALPHVDAFPWGGA